MPSPLYNDASLAESARKRKVFTDWAGVPLQPETPTPVPTLAEAEGNPPSADDILAGAKQTLAKLGVAPEHVDAAMDAAHPGNARTHATAYGDAYQAQPGDSPLGAAGEELWRTAAETGLGVLQSPVDAAKGLWDTIAHPVKTVEGLAHTVAHPVETAEAIGANPRMGGSLLAQLAVSPKLPEVAAEVPGVAGNTLGTVGRGMERLGTSAPMRTIGRLGPWEGLARGDWKGFAAAATPYALEYGGKGLQAIGEKISGTPQSLQAIKDLAEAKAAAPVAESTGSLATPEESVRETVRTARELQAGGKSRAKAAQMAGWPLGKSTEAPYRAGGSPASTEPFEGRMSNGDLSTPEQRAALRGLKNAMIYHDPRDPLVKGESLAAVGDLPIRDQEVLDMLRRARMIK